MVDLLRRPLPTVLARPVASIPASGGMPGGARYEPKWDGVRATVARREDGVSLWSRRGTDLTAAFPEISAAAAGLPGGTVLDGEVVAWVDGRLYFDVLLARINVGSKRAAALARENPASLVLFDVLVADGTDVRPLPYDERRRLLEQLTLEPPLALSPMTEDQAIAEQWFDDMAAAGIEGLVVKGGSQPYRGGERLWVKVKRRETIDVVVGAVIGPITRPTELVVGDLVDGELRIVGRSTPLSPAASRQLGQQLRPPAGAHPWPEVVSPGALSRFQGRGEPVKLTLVEPVVAEVSADSARVGGSFRHAVRFVRLRPDLS